MVNTPAPPIRTQENVNATRSSQEVSFTRTMSLALVPMEQNLHPDGTVTDFASGVGITDCPQDRPLLASGSPQSVRRKPVDLRCLEVPKANPRQRFVAQFGSIVVHRPVSDRHKVMHEVHLDRSPATVDPQPSAASPRLGGAGHKTPGRNRRRYADARRAWNLDRDGFKRPPSILPAQRHHQRRRCGYPIYAGKLRCAGKTPHWTPGYLAGVAV